MPHPCSMDQIERWLSESINWNKARIKFLVRFLVALITVKTVCLTQVASVFTGSVKPALHYKRIQRFLRHFEMDQATVARLVLALAGQEPPWVLALDRTNWKLGKTEVNLLVLALVLRGVAFPLFWTVLGRAGNSNTEQRIAVMERFIGVFGTDRIAFVCADREFTSKRWIAWLLAQGVSFRLRLKSNILVANGRGEMVCADWLFRDCSLRQQRCLAGKRRCLGQRLFVGGTRLAGGDFLVVLSDTEAELDDYALRWGIETLFGSLKSRGFCLQATHVVEAERLCKLLALLALAFCWAFTAGVWLAQQEPLKVKKHGRAAASLFRRGLDFLRRVLMPLCDGPGHRGQLQIVLRFLSCT